MLVIWFKKVILKNIKKLCDGEFNFKPLQEEIFYTTNVKDFEEMVNAEFVSKVDKKDISAFYPQSRRCNKLNWKQDIEDAYYALWAALNKGEMEEVFNPTCECEGSIWLPKQK